MGKNKHKGGASMYADRGASVFAAYMAAIPDPSSGDGVDVPVDDVPFPDSMRASTLLEQIGKERSWTDKDIASDIQTLSSNRIYFVRDLRVLSYQSWKVISLLPIVKDLLQQAVWRGVPSQKELKKRDKKEKKHKKNKYKHPNHDDSAQGDSMSLDINQQQQPPPVVGDLPAVEQGVADMTIAYEITPDANTKPVSESGELPRRSLVPVVEYVRKKPPRVPPVAFVQPFVPSPSSSSTVSFDSDSDSDSSAAAPTKTKKYGAATTSKTPATLPIRRILAHPSNPSRLRVTTATGVQYEVDRYCPHKNADLATWGALIGSNLVCNKHAWSFNLENGGICTKQGKGINACRVPEW